MFGRASAVFIVFAQIFVAALLLLGTMPEKVKYFVGAEKSLKFDNFEAPFFCSLEILPIKPLHFDGSPHLFLQEILPHTSLDLGCRVVDHSLQLIDFICIFLMLFLHFVKIELNIFLDKLFAQHSNIMISRIPNVSHKKQPNQF